MGQSEDRVMNCSRNRGARFGVSNVSFDDAKIYPTFITRLNETLMEMYDLVKEGHEIFWSKNENWCTVNGKIFNVSKFVYEKRIDRNGNLLIYDSRGYATIPLLN